MSEEVCCGLLNGQSRWWWAPWQASAGLEHTPSGKPQPLLYQPMTAWPSHGHLLTPSLCLSVSPSFFCLKRLTHYSSWPTSGVLVLLWKDYFCVETLNLSALLVAPLFWFGGIPHIAISVHTREQMPSGLSLVISVQENMNDNAIMAEIWNFFTRAKRYAKNNSITIVLTDCHWDISCNGRVCNGNGIFCISSSLKHMNIQQITLTPLCMLTQYIHIYIYMYMYIYFIVLLGYSFPFTKFFSIDKNTLSRKDWIINVSFLHDNF